MSELKLSITILVSYVITVLGIANIDNFQESVIDFSPIFFILIALVIFAQIVLTGALVRNGVKLNYYATVAFWLVIYVLVWVFYLQGARSIEILIIQGLLVLLSAILSFDVAKRIEQIDVTLEDISISAYPNRVRDIQSAVDLIAAELTRSRRYHHPLSILTIRFEKPKSKDGRNITSDMLERFTQAKVSQILSNLARSTDLILIDKNKHFVILCPETSANTILLIAERIAVAVYSNLKTNIEWGSASFPDEALTFADLLETAQSRFTPLVLDAP